MLFVDEYVSILNVGSITNELTVIVAIILFVVITIMVFWFRKSFFIPSMFVGSGIRWAY